MKVLSKFIPYLIATVIPLCWAGDMLLLYTESTKFPPFHLVFWRWMLSFTILIIFGVGTLKKDWETIKTSWGSFSWVSVLWMSFYITLLYVGLHVSPAIRGGIFQVLFPLLTVFLCLHYYGDKFTKTQILGIILCTAGANYIMFSGDWHNVKKILTTRGDILILVTSAIYGLYAAMLPRSSQIHPLSFLICLSFIGLVTMAPFYGWELSTVGTKPFDLKAWRYVAFVSVYPAGVAYTCWEKGKTLIGENKTGVLITLAPVFMALLANTVLYTPLKAFHLIGICLIFGGMILFNRIYNGPAMK